VSDLASRKRLLRATARDARAAARLAVPDAPERVAAEVRTLAAALGRPGLASGYLPVRDELDPLPAMAALAALGWRLALPVVVGAGQPLVFRSWRFGAPTVAAPFGLEVPAEGEAVEPELLLVPMLAFDTRGHRLGYGGGFYDRTIAALRTRNPGVRAVGIAFAAQGLPLLPDSETDMRLDAVLTEEGPVPLV
jgi:5-formyltetrahydrofolate cyclo-ligase